MSDTMLERVARAIFAEAGKQGAGHGVFDVLFPDVQDGLRLMARAAIEAMREPTENVVDAMNDVWIDGPGYVSMNASLHDCRVLFNAAIDAALQPAPDSEPAK